MTKDGAHGGGGKRSHWVGPERRPPESGEAWKRRIYRCLLLALPRDFRRTHEAEMEEAFLRLFRLAREKQGRLGTAQIWLGAVGDIVATRVRARRGRWGPHPDGPGDPKDKKRILIRSGRGGLPGTIAADVRFALRSLFRRPVLSGASILTLALGIGGNTAVFSVARTLLFRPLPYAAPGQLFMLRGENRIQGWSNTAMNLVDTWDYRARVNAFQDVAAYTSESVALTGDGNPEVLEAVEATFNLLSVLGVPPAHGRDLRSMDGQPESPGAVIITSGLWRRRFGEDPGVIGSTVTVDEERVTVVGILPSDFRFFDGTPEIIRPIRVDLLGESRDPHGSRVLARLAPGVSVEQAQQELSAVGRALEEEHPASNEGWGTNLVPLRSRVLGDGARTSLVLMAAVVFVLLIACANVANLLLARANSRRMEMAIRSAMGAGRGQLIRQQLTESLVLALFGGGAGLVLTVWGSQAIVVGLGDVGHLFDFGIDKTVLGFAAVVSLGAALLFGLVPAFRGSLLRGTELRDGVRSTSGRRRARFGKTLVMAQIALSVVLLIGGGIMIRSFVAMQRQDLGYEPENLLSFRLSPPDSRYRDGESVQALFEELLGRIRQLPGVMSASSVHPLPLSTSSISFTMGVEGRTDPEQGEGYPTRVVWVSSDYFETVRARIRQGRGFAASDSEDSPLVAIVNQTFAQEALAGLDPLMARIGELGAWRQVVGIVEDMLDRDLDPQPTPTMYLPVTQTPITRGNVVVRSAMNPSDLIRMIRQELLQIDPDLPAHDVRTLEDRIMELAGGQRMVATVMGVFALVALMLGAIGIYGVVSHDVSGRTHEIGIRLALGADQGLILRTLMREGVVRTLVGLGLGLLAALVLTRFMVGLLFGVSPTDPLTFGAVSAVLGLVSMLGTYVPVRRASRIDPVQALNAE